MDYNALAVKLIPGDQLSGMQYEDRVSFLEDILEFHPSYVLRISDSDQAFLAEVYYAGRTIDIESLAGFYTELSRNDPGRARQAGLSFERFVRANDVTYVEAHSQNSR